MEVPRWVVGTRLPPSLYAKKTVYMYAVTRATR
jgi:hypothetical protein